MTTAHFLELILYLPLLLLLLGTTRGHSHITPDLRIFSPSDTVYYPLPPTRSLSPSPPFQFPISHLHPLKQIKSVLGASPRHFLRL